VHVQKTNTDEQNSFEKREDDIAWVFYILPTPKHFTEERSMWDKITWDKSSWDEIICDCETVARGSATSSSEKV
jgi:hypothetical protein